MSKTLVSFRRLELILGLAVALLGLAVLARWSFHFSSLGNLLHGQVEMVANTALGMLLCGSSLAIHSRKILSKPIRYSISAMAMFVTVLGGASLAEILFGWNLGIDHLLFRDFVISADPTHPGRMSPATALSFILVGIALAVAAFPVSKSIRRPLLTALAAAVATSGVLVLIGIFSEVIFGYCYWNCSGMALSTALGFFFLGLGLLALIQSDEPLNWWLGRLPTAGFVGGIVLMQVAAGIAFNSAKETYSAAGWVSHTQEVLKEIRDITLDMGELKINQRGYLIAGDEQILASRGKIKATIQEDLGDIRRIASDNPKQQICLEQLRWLIDRRIAFEDESIDVRRQKGAAASEQILVSSNGTKLSAEVSGKLDEMVDEENRLLDGRVTHLRDNSTLTFLLLPFGVVLSVVMLSMGLVFLNNGMGDRIKAEQAIRESESRLAGIVNSAMDAIISIDSGQHVVLFNAAAEKVFRCSAAEAMGRSIDQFIPHRFRAWHRQHVEGFGHSNETSRSLHARGELSGLRAEGGEFPIEASISQVEVSGHKIFTVILRDITERKRAEADASLLSSIVESSVDAIVGKDLNGNVTRWNAGAQLMFGYSASEMVGRSMLQVIPPDRRNEEAKILDKIRRGEHAEHFETIRQKKDGGLIDVSVTMSPIKDKAGKIVGASKVSHDITERKRSESRFRRLVDSNVQGVIFWNSKGAITGANDAFLRMVGYTREDLEAGHISWALMTPPEYADLDRHALEELATRGANTPYEKEFIRKDGSRVPILLGAATFENNPEEGVGFVLDVTERKRAQDALRESEKQLLLITNNVPGLISYMDRDLRYQFVNAAYEKAFNLPAEKIVGRTVKEIVGEEVFARVEPFAKQALSGELATFQNYMTGPAGQLQHVNITFVPHSAPDEPVKIYIDF